jgi:hypothetical protein
LACCWRERRRRRGRLVDRLNCERADAPPIVRGPGVPQPGAQQAGAHNMLRLGRRSNSMDEDTSFDAATEARIDALSEEQPAVGGEDATGPMDIAPPPLGLCLRDSLRSSLASNEDAGAFMPDVGDAGGCGGGFRLGSLEEPSHLSRAAGGGLGIGPGDQWEDSQWIAPPSRNRAGYDPWGGAEPEGEPVSELPPKPRRGRVEESSLQWEIDDHESAAGGVHNRAVGGGGDGSWAAVGGGGRAASVRGVAAPPTHSGLVVCLDWDCTLTTRHMHKDSGQRGQGGMHSGHFFQWCAEHGVDSATSRAGLSAIDRLDFGADTEHVCVEYFFGGRERIAQLTAFLQRMKAHGAVLCILTNGETAVIHRHFTTVLSAWAQLFSGGWVGNIHDEVSVSSVPHAHTGLWPPALTHWFVLFLSLQYFITENDGSVGASATSSAAVEPTGHA